MSNYSSAYKYSKCPEQLSSSCVTWESAGIPCLNICQGDNLSIANYNMAQAICQLIGEVDMSSIIIPECLQLAWGTNQPDILNFITLLVNNQCTIQDQLTSINNELATIDPLITVNFCTSCTNSNPCVQTGTITVSEAINSTILCLCNLYLIVNAQQLEITNLQNELGTFATQVQLNTQISALQTQITSLQVNLSNNVTGLQASINCLNIKTGSTC